MIECATLVVMAKAPRVGVGKQRLAREVGRVEAWRINRALQAHTLRVACDRRWRTILCVTPDEAARLLIPAVWPRFRSCAHVGGEVERVPQGRGDLGARLARALGGRTHVAVIGTDAPDLSRVHLASAFAALRRAPFALGPSEDGGFWILAARSGDAAARAMEGVRWSTPHAGGDVLANLDGAVARLATLRDVDVGADLRRGRVR